MEWLSQEAMGRLFAVTDALELDREQLTVPLERSGDGDVRRGPGGRWEIKLPAGEEALERFLGALPQQLRSAGFVAPASDPERDDE